VQVPEEFTVTPAGPMRYDLQPLGHCSFDLTVTARPGTAPGRRFATAQIEVAGQVVEDSAMLAVGQPRYPDRNVPPDQARTMREAADTALEGELDLSLISPTAAIRPGGTGTVEVLLRNRTGTGIHGEAQLISPHGSWPQTRPWTTGFTLAAGAAASLPFSIAIPAAARPGEQWWAIVKAMYFGRVQYSEPIEVTIC
jgi:alpha-mannosidase